MRKWRFVLSFQPVARATIRSTIACVAAALLTACGPSLLHREDDQAVEQGKGLYDFVVVPADGRFLFSVGPPITMHGPYTGAQHVVVQTVESHFEWSPELVADAELHKDTITIVVHGVRQWLPIDSSITGPAMFWHEFELYKKHYTLRITYGEVTDIYRLTKNSHPTYANYSAEAIKAEFTGPLK